MSLSEASYWMQTCFGFPAVLFPLPSVISVPEEMNNKHVYATVPEEMDNRHVYATDSHTSHQLTHLRPVFPTY